MWEGKSEKTGEVVFSTSDPTAILSGLFFSVLSVSLAKRAVRLSFSDACFLASDFLLSSVICHLSSGVLTSDLWPFTHPNAPSSLSQSLRFHHRPIPRSASQAAPYPGCVFGLP